MLWGRTGLLSVLWPMVPALSDGGKSLKSPRDWGFGHVALVLPYFREHLFSETPALSGAASLLPGECFKVQAGLAQARWAFCPAWAQACGSCRTYVKHGWAASEGGVLFQGSGLGPLIFPACIISA